MAVPVIGLRGSFSAGFSARWYYCQRPPMPVTSGLVAFSICYRLFGETHFKTAQSNVGSASSDATPIGHLAIFSQECRCQKASESNYIQTTATRQLHAGHVSRLIERIDSIPANDSRSLEATGSLSNADCFEWPATTNFRARYRSRSSRFEC